jgi:hypothetical protein
MNYNQNEKIAQITSQTLIIGVDILNTSMWQEPKTLEV